MRSITYTLLVGMLACTCISQAEMRDWKDKQGRKIQAELVSCDGTTVSLKLRSGKTVPLPITKLCDEDQSFLNEQSSDIDSDNGDTGAGQLTPPNFAQPWPESIKTDENFEVKTIKEGPDQFIYESPHFKYISDAKLGLQLIRAMGRMFEATYDINKSLPIANKPTRDPQVKFPIFLFEKKSDYIAAGGPPDAAGVQITKGNDPTEPYGHVLVPFESLGVQKVGSGYRMDRAKDFHTLIHEVTHQLMGREVKQASWFTEGTAEYVGMTPYSNGRFALSNNRSSIVASVTAYGKGKENKGRALGKDINLPYSLEEFMNMDYASFTGNDGNTNYGIAPLLIYYFYHGDGTGDAAQIKAYIKALQKGTPEVEAQQLLLNKRTWAQLDDAISKFWRRAGITLKFAKKQVSQNENSAK
ncbi:MAG: SHD1 domain-containing protein [Akkermansia sp.]